MISIVINADTRPHDRLVSTVGDYGGGSLQGCRSWDFLTDGVAQKQAFFRGHDFETIVYIDVHAQLPQEVTDRLLAMRCRVEMQPHSEEPNWNDLVYLRALRLAQGDYVAHFDQDANAMRADDSPIVDRMMTSLEIGGLKFICQPTNLTPEQHGMWWASTRFFVCLRDTLDFDALEKAIHDRSSIYAKYPWDGPNHLPCFEHILGVIGSKGRVYYPAREDHHYLIWSWVRYREGLLARLNDMNYADVRRYVADECGLCGPNDVLAKEELP